MCTWIKEIQREIKPVFILQPIIWGKHFKLFVRCKFKTSIVRPPVIIEYTESTYTILCLWTLHIPINWSVLLHSFPLVLLPTMNITCEISIHWLKGFFLVLYMCGCTCIIIIHKLELKHMHTVMYLWSTTFVTKQQNFEMIYSQC